MYRRNRVARNFFLWLYLLFKTSYKIFILPHPFPLGVEICLNPPCMYGNSKFLGAFLFTSLFMTVIMSCMRSDTTH